MVARAVFPVAVSIAAAAVAGWLGVLSDPNDEIFEEYEAALVWSASGFDSTAIRLVTATRDLSGPRLPVMVAMMQPLDKEVP